MKSVRVFYKKKGRMKFVSHLDMNRYFLRLVKLAKLPIWYTEGFNPHPYITFALPLSLGFESEYEVVDMRVEDGCGFEEIKTRLSQNAVEGIEIFGVDSPKLKPSEILKAEYRLEFDGEFDTEGLAEFLKRDSIIAFKKTKKGVEKQINLGEMIFDFDINENASTVVEIVLSAGESNLNPLLLIDTYTEMTGIRLPEFAVTRTKLLTRSGELFV